jgi:hypothetical protein
MECLPIGFCLLMPSYDFRPQAGGLLAHAYVIFFASFIYYLFAERVEILSNAKVHESTSGISAVGSRQFSLEIRSCSRSNLIQLIPISTNFTAP